MQAFCAPKGYWLISCDEANLKYGGSLVRDEAATSLVPRSSQNLAPKILL